MATHDYNLANQDGASFRSDLNNALSAIVSNNSSSTAPATTFAHQIWVDTTANVIKQRNAANDAWVELWRIDGGFNAKTFSSNVTLNAQSDLRFADSDSSNWVAFQAPATVSSNVTWTLPSADGTADQALTTNGSGVLSWADAGGVQDNITEGNTSAEVVDTGSDGHFKVVTEGTEALRVDSSQRVGIGTTPDSAFHLRGASAKFEADSNSAQFFITPDATPSGGVNLNVSYGGSGSYGPLSLTTGGSERARIDSSGRLLVGTTSSASTNCYFQSIGNPANNAGTEIYLGRNEAATKPFAAGNSLATIRFGDNAGANFASIHADVDGASGSGDYPGRLSFHTTADGASSQTERMRINRFGYLTTNSDSVGMSVHVVGTSNNIFEGYNGASNGSYNGTNKIYIENDGDIKNTNNSYGAISDIKLKENIVDAASQWNDLKAIQVRNYNFKEETGHETHTQLGVIAQEIELVSPGLVSESLDRDEDGNDLGTTTKSVNYSVLYMKAVKALQEAMTRIETLETKVAALEAA